MRSTIAHGVRDIIWINTIHISNVSSFSVLCVSLFCVRAQCVTSALWVCRDMTVTNWALPLGPHWRHKTLSQWLARDLNCPDHNLIIAPDREITTTRIIDKGQTISPHCNDQAIHLFVVAVDHHSQGVFWFSSLLPIMYQCITAWSPTLSLHRQCWEHQTEKFVGRGTVASCPSPGTSNTGTVGGNIQRIALTRADNQTQLSAA